MLGEEERCNEEGSFSNTSIPKRIAVVLAGGIVNIIFGLLVYFILVSISGNYISTTIDSVIPGYSAKQSKIEVGDKILKINNKVVRLKSDVDAQIQDSNGNEIKITVQRNNEIKEVELIPTEERDKYIGIYLGATENDLNSEIKDIHPNSPAENGRFKKGRYYNKN